MQQLIKFITKAKLFIANTLITLRVKYLYTKLKTYANKLKTNYKKNKRPLTILLLIAIVLSLLSFYRITEDRRTQVQNELENVSEQLETQSKEASELEDKLEDKTDLLKEAKTDVEKLQEEKESKDAEIQQLKKDLQAKLEREEAARLARATPTPVSTPVVSNEVSTPEPVVNTPTVSVSGTKESWMTAAGIPQSQWWAVDSIVSRESGWNPCAYNPGKSNCNLSAAQVNATKPVGINVACGLGQQLPCGKWDAYGHWTDPVAALKAQYDYVNARYGGYAGAVSFWNVNHWY